MANESAREIVNPVLPVSVINDELCSDDGDGDDGDGVDRVDGVDIYSMDMDDDI